MLVTTDLQTPVPWRKMFCSIPWRLPDSKRDAMAACVALWLACPDTPCRSKVTTCSKGTHQVRGHQVEMGSKVTEWRWQDPTYTPVYHNLPQPSTRNHPHLAPASDMLSRQPQLEGSGAGFFTRKWWGGQVLVLLLPPNSQEIRRTYLQASHFSLTLYSRAATQIVCVIPGLHLIQKLQ